MKLQEKESKRLILQEERQVRNLLGIYFNQLKKVFSLIAFMYVAALQ
jgi:hypothetical protein